MKKLVSLLLSFVMVFSFAAVAVSADEPLPATGVIYLNEMRTDTVYKLYKVFDLASVSSDGTAFSYTINTNKDAQDKYVDPWADFVLNDEIAKKYLSVDNNGAISKTAAFIGDDATIELAKAAIAFANNPAKGVTPFVTSETENNNFERTTSGGTFKNLPAGYYLFESAVGTLGALVTARPNVPAYINIKNKAPSVEKIVQEDSVNEWLANNSADIGQKILFKATIDAQAGAENYAFHDKMSGMELWKTGENKYEISVVHSRNIFDAAAGEEKEVPLTEGRDYELKINPHEDVTFGIKFTPSFCDKIKANDKIIISYSAKLTNTATIAGSGNTNICWVRYGAMNGAEPAFRTADSTTYTHTYGVDIVKTTNNNASLPGAEFNLYPALPNGTIDENNPVKFTYNEADKCYYVDPNGSKDFVANTKVMKETVNGEELEGGFAVATLVGLDNGTYFLRETAAPAGYNALTEDRVFTISSSNMQAGFRIEKVTETPEGGTPVTKVKTTYTGGGIHIENQKGDKLPETGGMGTTLFVTIGAITAIGAGVLLVTKKRMSMIDD